MKLIHQKQIKITDVHLDELNHVNNVQYVHWMEEMAKEHWDILKKSTPFADDFWVLADHHIQYKKQVFKDEILTLKTYPEKPEGLRQPRKVEFYRGEELVVDSRTMWVLFDHKTHKIKRLDDNWLDLINES